jgi:hypothetical protein
MTATEVTEPLDANPPSNPMSPDNILDIHKSGHPRNGKIAKLPKDQRDELNQMLADGATGALIIETFARRGISLNHENVSNWRQGGHQDWLQLQVWRAEMIAEAESVSDLFTNNDESTFHQVVIRVAITQIFQSLKKGKLNDDPANYTRLLNSLARLTREALCLRKYGDTRADALAPLQPRPDYERKLTDKERRALVRKVDEVLGLVSPEPDTETSSEDGESSAGRPPAPTSTVASFNGDRAGLSRHPVPPRSDEGRSVIATADLSPIAGLATVEASRATVKPATAEVVAPKRGDGELAAPEPNEVSSISNQESKVQIPEDLCPKCDSRLPQLLPDGQRPWTNCRICGAPAPPPPTPPSGDFCHQCRSLLPPLLSNGERPSPHCDHCGASLRLPGALIEYCPHCRACLPELLPNGQRPNRDCTACGVPPPPPPSSATNST